MTSLSDKKKIVYPDLGEMGVIGYEVLMPEDVKEAIKELSEALEPLNKWRNVFHASSDKDEMECAIAINEFFEEFKRIFGKGLV